MLLTALYSLGSTFFVALIVTLGKVSVIDVDSNLSTAFRARAVLAIARVMATVAGKVNEVFSVSRMVNSLLFPPPGLRPVPPDSATTESSSTASPAWSCPSIGLSLLVALFFSALVLRKVANRRYLVRLTMFVDGTLTTLT